MRPSCMIRKALRADHDENWADAYTKVDEIAVPRHANVISSHVIYKIKSGEDGSKSLRATICPHGNRDAMKDEVRKDSATAQFEIMRLMLSLSTFAPMKLGLIDVSGACMQR